MKKDDDYQFIKHLTAYLKEVMVNGVPEIANKMMRRARGVALAKPGDKGYDADVRPLCLFDSTLSLKDNIIWKNVPVEQKLKAIESNESKAIESNGSRPTS